MKQILTGIGAVVGGVLFVAMIAYAATVLIVPQGGTGRATLTGGSLLYGNGSGPVGLAATTSVTCSGNTTCSTFTAIGPSPITISSTASFSFPFTPTTYGSVIANATTTLIKFNSLTAASSSIGVIDAGSITASSSITNKSVTSALVLNSSTGLEGAYAGSNPCIAGSQAAFSISATGVITCASVNTSAWPFTNATYGSLAAAATTTVMNFSAFVSASSTIGNIQAGNITASTSLSVATTTPFGRVSIDTTGLAAGQPSFVVGSSTRTDMVITQNGFVGLGQQVPTTLLHLKSANSTIYIDTIDTNNAAQVSFQTVNHLMSFSSNNQASGGNGGAGFYDNTNGAWTFMIRHTDGFVGIDTDTPSTALTVNGSITTNANVILGTSGAIKEGANTILAGNGTNTLIRPDSSGGSIQIQSFAGGTNTTLKDGGSIGIGTTTPGTLLSIQGVANFGAPNATIYSNIRFPSFIATSTTATSTVAGPFSQGSTTPFAFFSIHAGSGQPTTYVNNIIFAVGSSSPTSTSTLLMIDNKGTHYMDLVGSTSTLINLLRQTFLQSATTSGLLTLGETAGGQLLATSTTAGNTIIGFQALQNATSTRFNTALGYQALQNLVDYAASANVAVGYQAEQNLTLGKRNVAIGRQALQAVTTGQDNNAQGDQSLFTLTTGVDNTAMGTLALSNLTAGRDNTCIGYSSCSNLQSNFSSNNVMIGSSAQGGSQTNNNVIIGYGAGNATTDTGSSTILIGANVDATSTNEVGGLDIGNILYGTGVYDNFATPSSAPTSIARVGVATSTPRATFAIEETPTNSSTTPVFLVGDQGTSSPFIFVSGSNGSVGIGTTTPLGAFSTNGHVWMRSLTASGSSQAGDLCISASNEVVNDTAACIVSSRRFKHDITSLDSGLTTIMALRPVAFTYNETGNPLFDKRGPQVGFIAEEAYDVDPRLVELDDSGQPRSFLYEQFTSVLTKALQEQQQEIENIQGGTDDPIRENWQWAVIVGLIIWNLYLTFRKRV